MNDRRDIIGKLRRKAGGKAVEGMFRGLSTVSKMTPPARRALSSVEIHRDQPYQSGTKDDYHTLDIYLPTHVDPPYPVMLYVHGGGFRILSKDTHWLMGVGFARRGFAVFNVNYRLAPAHPFPAAVEDVCRAYRWVYENAARFGGDLSRFVLAGESAGANLATTLALASAHRRDEPWAREVFDTELRAKAVIAACGMLQVTDPGRFGRRRSLPPWLGDRIIEVSEPYLNGIDIGSPTAALADPLVMLESDLQLERELPPFLAFAGTRDPILDDTRRLETALRARGVHCEAEYYQGEVHAFHAFVWRDAARRCWQRQFDFLDQHASH